MGLALVGIGVMLIVAGLVALLLPPARDRDARDAATNDPRDDTLPNPRPVPPADARVAPRASARSEPPVVVAGSLWPTTSGESVPLAIVAPAADSPEPPVRGGIRLRLTVTGPGRDDRERVVTLRDRHVAGRRAPDEALRFPEDAHMSARHCELSVEEGAIMLRDLDSSNGTIVNGVPVLAGQRYRVDDGDVIRIGETELRVAFVEGERPSADRPAQRGPASREVR